jgi:hypothetical protein
MSHPAALMSADHFEPPIGISSRRLHCRAPSPTRVQRQTTTLIGRNSACRRRSHTSLCPERVDICDSMPSHATFAKSSSRVYHSMCGAGCVTWGPLKSENSVKHICKGDIPASWGFVTISPDEMRYCTGPTHERTNGVTWLLLSRWASIVASVTMISEIAASAVKVEIQIELDRSHTVSIMPRCRQSRSTEIDCIHAQHLHVAWMITEASRMMERKCSGKVIVCIMLPIMTAISVDQKLDIYIKKTQRTWNVLSVITKIIPFSSNTQW